MAQKNPEHSIIEIPDFVFEAKCNYCTAHLSAEAESLDNSTIAIDIAVVQIVEQSTAFADKLSQRTGSSMIFTVLLQMFRQMGNTV